MNATLTLDLHTGGGMKMDEAKRDWVYLLAYFATALLAIIMFFANILEYKAGLIGKPLLLFPALLLACLLCEFVFLVRRFSGDPQKIFLLVSFPAVLALGLFVVPGTVPDENAHIAQALDLFGRHSGNFLVPKVLNPASLPQKYADLYAAISASGTWGTMISYNRYIAYADGLYAIPAMVISVLRVFDVNAMLAVIVARLVNGTLFCAAGYFFIRLLPSGKTALMVFLLNPMLVQQEASLSADVLVNIAAIAFVVYFLKLNSQKEITKKELLIFAALTVAMAVSKMMFAPLVLLWLVFLNRKLVGKKLLAVYLGVFIACCALAAVIVAFYRGSFFPASFELMRSPGECVRVLLNSIWVAGPFWINSYLGQFLGSLNIATWTPCVLAYLVLQIVVLFYNDEDCDDLVCGVDKAFVSILCFVNLILLVLTMREWSLEVDKVTDYILGIQGRYFFPLVLLPLCCLLRPGKRRSEGHVLVTSAALLVAIFSINMIPIITFYL